MPGVQGGDFGGAGWSKLEKGSEARQHHLQPLGPRLAKNGNPEVRPFLRRESARLGAQTQRASARERSVCGMYGLRRMYGMGLLLARLLVGGVGDAGDRPSMWYYHTPPPAAAATRTLSMAPNGLTKCDGSAQ